jgi:hypothetical protein
MPKGCHAFSERLFDGCPIRFIEIWQDREQQSSRTGATDRCGIDVAEVKCHKKSTAHHCFCKPLL